MLSLSSFFICQDCDRHDIELQTEILTCLTTCLKESHKCRTNFRKKSGFQCLVGVLAGLAGCLQEKSDGHNEGDEWRDSTVMIKFIQG